MRTRGQGGDVVRGTRGPRDEGERGGVGRGNLNN